ncbi:MAG: GIY-YIG nuclease family protein [Bacteroidia bacterium]|nr:GIY-YIG nuclease family protein [Bacteroidia bacterium]
MKNGSSLKLTLSTKRTSESSSSTKYRFAQLHNFYVYILLCSDESYYVGVTNSLDRRLKEHSSGHCEKSYTNSRLPVQLIYFEEFKYILKAIAREKQLKGWSRKKKEALIKGNLHELIMLAQYANTSNYAFQNFMKYVEKNFS